jgi:DNA-binding XRE family transcriptional regulator
MATKSHESQLTPDQRVRIEAAKARRRTPEARAEEAEIREALDREYRETGTIKAAGDAIETEDMIAFSRFMFSLRRERERLGLSLADVAKFAGIDKAALSRLENGLQVNPTVNTLARYVRALGKSLKWGVADPE